MDYTIIITEYDSDNVDESFTAIHGRNETWLDLTNKTYTKYRIADNTPKKTTILEWSEHIPQIEVFIQVEINRVNAALLLEKTRLHEITYFRAYMKIGLDETPETVQANIDSNQAILTYLKNYKP